MIYFNHSIQQELLLTAIETFKPLVINTHNQNQAIPYQGSTIESYMDAVDLAFDSNDSAEKKIKKTKEILNTFKIVYEGKSLSNQFSQQRKWLNDTFESCASYDDKKEFVHRLSNLTRYWSDIKNAEPTPFDAIHRIRQVESDLVTLCLKYLDDSIIECPTLLLVDFFHRC